MKRFTTAALIAGCLLLAGSAEAAPKGMVKAIKTAIAQTLNHQGVFPPTALMAPYEAKDVRIRTRTVQVLNICDFDCRVVSWNVGSVGGKILGNAKAYTPKVPNGGPLTTTQDIEVTKTPWTIP